MLFFKRQKIEAWLRAAPASPFAALLSDWRSGAMAKELALFGITRLEFHIDWLPDYRCISIQGTHSARYVDIQIEPDTFFIAVDEDEPDDPREYPLESARTFYQTVGSVL